MSYFILWAGAMYPGERTRRLEGGDWGGLEAGAFIDGAAISAPFPNPVEIDLVPDEKGTAEMPPLWVVPALVVRKDVAEALRAIGVDNVQYHSAVLHDRARNRRWDNYLVGNVIGTMDVIDMKKSVLDPDSPPGIAMLFDTMVLDEEKCRGAMMFRLMHRQNLIVISDRVADCLRSKNYPFLHIVPPEDFA